MDDISVVYGSSMWQLLRGSSIVFVALMKNYILGDKLKPIAEQRALEEQHDR